MCKTSTKFDFHSVRNTKRLEFDTPAAPLCAIAGEPNANVCTVVRSDAQRRLSWRISGVLHMP